MEISAVCGRRAPTSQQERREFTDIEHEGSESVAWEEVVVGLGGWEVICE